MGRLLAIESILLGIVGLVTLGVALAGRVAFGWPLEWMEGASLQHALELWEHGRLYTPPHAEFTPFIYPPLSYVPMALSAALLGPTLPAARLPSVLASLAALALLSRTAAREADSRRAGWLCAGFFALGFGYAGAFYDLARIDALFVMLVAAGAERLSRGRPGSALGCFALSCFAKQHGLLFLLSSSAWLVARDARGHLRPVASAWGATLLGFVLLHAHSDGWSTLYLFAVPAAQPAHFELLFSYLLVDVALYLPLLAAASLGPLLRGTRPTALHVLLLAALGASALGRAHAGGFDNVRIPGLALLSLAGSVALGRWLDDERLGRTRRMLLALGVALQAALLFQLPTHHWPPPRAQARFEALARALQRCAEGGRAVALDHGLLAGTPYAHTMALSDLRMAEGLPLGRMATSALLADLAATTAPDAIAVGERFDALERTLARRYEVCARPPAPHLTTGYTPRAPTVLRRTDPDPP